MLNWIVEHTYHILGAVVLLILMLLVALYNAPMIDFDEDDQP